MTRLLAIAALGISCSVAAEAKSPDPITAAIQKRIAGQTGLADVQIDAYWARNSKRMSARVFGDGVGIWQRQFQFQLTKDQVVGILKILRKADFGSLPDYFGEVEREGEEPEEPKEGPQLRGRLSVRAGTASKTIVQLIDGDQSKEFEVLVNRVLDVCEGPGSKGTGAASMEEGLRLLAEGKLSPHILETSVQKPPDPKASEAPDDGWTLRTTGVRAATERTATGKPPTNARELLLGADDFRALAKALADGDPASLPQSLYATRYTDLTVDLFGYHRTIAGRRFLGMTPQTHGDKQKAFDRLIDTFTALRERVDKQGRPVAAVPPPSRAPKKETKERERD